MKKILMSILIIVILPCYAEMIVDDLEGHWQTSAVIGFLDEIYMIKTPALSKNKKLPYYDEKRSIYYSKDGRISAYGSQVVFSKDLTFESYYSASCGNDCFRSSKGHYKIIDNEHLQLYLDELSQRGLCDKNFSHTETKDLGVFTLEKTEHGINLKIYPNKDSLF